MMITVLNIYVNIFKLLAIEAVDKDVGKGKTIRFLQNLLNISSEQTIVFGDG